MKNGMRWLIALATVVILSAVAFLFGSRTVAVGSSGDPPGKSVGVVAPSGEVSGSSVRAADAIAPPPNDVVVSPKAAASVETVAAKSASFAKVAQQGLTSNSGADISAAYQALVTCMLWSPNDPGVLNRPVVPITPSIASAIDVNERKALIADTVEKCSGFSSENGGTQVPSGKASAALRQRLGGLSLANLTDDDLRAVREALSSGRLDAVALLAKSLAEAELTVPGKAADNAGNYVQAAASMMAMCKIADVCDAGGFLARQVCLDYGACTQGGVVDLHRTLHEKAGLPFSVTQGASDKVAAFLVNPDREAANALAAKLRANLGLPPRS